MKPNEENDGLTPAAVRQLLAVEGYLELKMPAEAHAEFNDLDQSALGTPRASELGLRVGYACGLWPLVAMSAFRLSLHQPEIRRWPGLWREAVAHRGVPEALLESIRRNADLMQNDGHALFNAALVAARLGRRRTARKFLRRATRLNHSLLGEVGEWDELAGLLP